ncbi:MAG: hypothetical protein QI199_02830 [Candidatus Korarchaeota archaeon]|nr:hypothetical protein [Candidatus Korarchaeota archaeon]
MGIALLKAKKMIIWGSAAELHGGISLLSNMTHILDGAVYFNAYLIDQRLIERVLRKLEDYRPDILRGLPHFLAAVAEYALRRGIGGVQAEGCDLDWGNAKQM